MAQSNRPKGDEGAPRGAGQNADGRSEVIRASSEFLGHGLALAASVALFGWLGAKLGDWVGARSVLTLLGMLLGGAAGFYSIYLRLVVRPRLERENPSGGSGEG